MDYEQFKEKFHFVSGCFIAGQIFVEYALFLKEHYSPSVKGDTTRKNRLIEAEAAVNRLTKVFEG